MRRLPQLTLLAASLAGLLAASLPLRTLAEPEPANGDPTRAEAAVPVAPADPKLEERLQLADILGGLTGVEGPGLIVTLRNSTKSVPKGADKSSLLIQDQDVNAVFAALRSAGAEALAITGKGALAVERVMPLTVASGTKGGIFINTIAMQPPYQVFAIGDGKALRAGLFAADGLIRRAGLDALGMIEAQEAASIMMPPARVTPTVKYAKPRNDIPIVANVVSSLPANVTLPPALPATKIAPPEPNPIKPAAGTAPSPAPAVSPQPVAQVAGSVFGAKGNTKYHAPGCRFGERIPTGERVSFATAAEAAATGRTPCRVCAQVTAR